MLSKLTLRVCAGFISVIAASYSPVFAATITAGDFSGAETTTTFDGLGLPFMAPTPLVLDGNTFTTSETDIGYYTAIAECDNDCVGSRREGGFIDIVLGGPVNRIGFDIGATGAWSATVDLYDAGDALIATLNLSNAVAGLIFAGYETATGVIARVRINDGASDFRVTLIDNLRFEFDASIAPEIPLPAAAPLFLAGLAGLFSARRQRRRRQH